ncbi:type II restriction endonuclease [Scytonema sp. UIC 10036]|uniref:Eco57I restriction-modification methylase domain-containing protein n=1 Tax=Scytonema sp. UIC 10036 TaxID=2304196 RepID=UPI0012DA6F40|nr:TaqI-like C-terminal specificity domain-containing protein [Scytonema sp. UIC 10036]MUG92820.1 type II restriction endonuclease [Scytonema sp. UIC 10036]
MAAERLLQLGDIRDIKNPEKIASLFRKIGYNTFTQQLAVDELELPARSAEAVWNAYLIADHQKGSESLQVLLFQLQGDEWSSPGLAGNRMRSLAQSLCRRPTNFLLLGTKDYDQLMLVNPRKSFDAQMNLKVGIRKLLIDRTNPTNYDRDRLEAIAARNFSPQELYQVQCDAFDVEKLTKQFYREYHEIFEEVKRVIKANNRHSYFEDPSRLHQFSQRLLGRIMFLYFLQKKEFLGGNRDFLRTEYRKLRSESEDPDFYQTILEPLFFDTLNKQRPNHDSPWGKIPYLNGGLFDRDYGDGIVDATDVATPSHIHLPNSLFDPSNEKGILQFFNSYNFTISENIQGDEEAAVDPEMLGKVFENLLASEERGQSGTFYTPRGIVHFMCVESLSCYLADTSGVDVEVIKQLINVDLDLPDKQFKQLLTNEQAKKLKRALESVKICDPAVGSGAYPLGMMQVMLAVRQAIARREGITVERGSLAISEWKRDIIANNLYGVDIKPEAIEIAKLRMWLSLIVDVPNIEDVEPLPNLDYKLMCGDSLISTIHGERLIPDPTKDLQIVLNVTPIHEAIQPLIDLQHQYFASQSDERKSLREQILEAEKNVFRVAIGYRRQYWETEYRKLQQDIQRMKGKASRTQTQKQQEITTKLQELDAVAAEVERGMRSLSFFQWHLHFNKVFQQKGGFDIVIGNPPYVRQEKLSEEYKKLLKIEFPDLFKGTADIYTYFYGRGVNLLHNGGYLTYISSNKYMRAGYGDKLRQFLGNQSTVHQLIDFGNTAVFEAIAYPSIILVSKALPSNQQTQTLTWEAGQSVEQLSSVFRANSFLMTQKELTPDGWRLETPSTLRLLEKLRNTGLPLGKYVQGRFYYGIKTGLNEAFVVDRATRDKLIAEHLSSADVLKPFLRGRDVKQWRVDFAEQYLIKIESSENKQHQWSGKSAQVAEKIFAKSYPAIYNHFQLFRSRLMNRDDQGKYFWELRSCKYWQEFEQPKIVIPAIAQNVEYAADSSQFFSNDKTSICIIDNVNYLLGLLNSKVLWWFIQQIASTKQGGFYEFKPMYVSQLPISDASVIEQKTIEFLVQACLDAKGQGVENWEAEIDDRVAHLYGLTSEEIKIIQGE